MLTFNIGEETKERDKEPARTGRDLEGVRVIGELKRNGQSGQGQRGVERYLEAFRLSRNKDNIPRHVLVLWRSTKVFSVSISIVGI